jgi:hypothetical protein
MRSHWNSVALVQHHWFAYKRISHVKTQNNRRTLEIETGVTHLQAKEHQGLLGITKSQKRHMEPVALRAPGRNPHHQCLALVLLAFRAERK